jgi:uncharacterized membrane protein (DUF4010 family)
MKNIFSPYSLSQVFKLLALIAIVWITSKVPNPFVASIAIFIIGTLIASEAFILMLARSLRKEPTDENIVKLFIAILFRDKDQANKILDDYRKEKSERNEIEKIKHE